VPEVIDGPQSMIYPEAVARLHIARALLLYCLHPAWADLVAAAADDVFDRRLDEIAERPAVRVFA
jgi:ornithine carbamoyltransferase